MSNRSRPVHFDVVVGDALDANVDVLVLKYAQGFHGVDKKVADALPAGALSRLPSENDFQLLAANGAATAREILLIGVPPLGEFRYREIRLFAERSLAVLASERPTTTTLAITLHGAGYGLDEAECFRSELAGLTNAVTSGNRPRDLHVIHVMERDPRRAGRLKELLAEQLPGGHLDFDLPDLRQQLGDERADRLQSVGFDSSAKPYAFVAMPINDDTEDLFHYGIRQAVDACGLLCERIDQTPAVGDILDRIKERIAGANLVIAELSGRNPNVYLEVGYAWGKGVPTILLVRKDELGDLGFDVKGQRCVVYNKIKEVEAKLVTELHGLGLDLSAN